MFSAGNSKTNVAKNVGYNKLSSHDDYLLDEKNGNIVPQHNEKNVKEKFDEVMDLHHTSDFEEELTDDSDYGKRTFTFYIYFSNEIFKTADDENFFHLNLFLVINAKRKDTTFLLTS